MNLTILAQQYVCAECHAPLTLRYNAEPHTWDSSIEGDEWMAVCTMNAMHRGFTTRATVEIEEERSRQEAYRIMHDPELREALPWLPEPEAVGAEQAMNELFEA